MEKIKFTNEDWEALVPGIEYKIGNVKLPLRPVNIEEVTKIARVIRGAKDFFKDKNIDKGNFKNPDNLAVVFEIIMETIPELISDCSGLALADVKRLPADIGFELFNKLLEINLKSKGSLEKNFKALLGVIQEVSPVKKTNGKSVT